MFKRHTLFVIGAGASKELNMPVGAELAKAIQAVSRIVLDPETATLSIHWHHTSVPTNVPFFSRHIRVFDDHDNNTTEKE
jgi:hypothetical protein